MRVFYLVYATTPAFEAPYAGVVGVGVSPASEATLMTRSPLDMCLKASCAPYMVPIKFMRTMSGKQNHFEN